jgi:hypothetical protein
LLISPVRLFQNIVLRKIFEAKREEVTGDWRRLHNVELFYMYYSANIIRVNRSKRIR